MLGEGARMHRRKRILKAHTRLGRVHTKRKKGRQMVGPFGRWGKERKISIIQRKREEAAPERLRDQIIRRKAAKKERRAAQKSQSKVRLSYKIGGKAENGKD